MQPEGAQREAAKSRILFVIRIKNEQKKCTKSVLPTQGRVLPQHCRSTAAEAHWTNGHFATVLGTGEIQPTNDRLQPQILTTVSGIEAILEVQYEGGW